MAGTTTELFDIEALHPNPWTERDEFLARPEGRDAVVSLLDRFENNCAQVAGEYSPTTKQFHIATRRELRLDGAAANQVESVACGFVGQSTLFLHIARVQMPVIYGLREGRLDRTWQWICHFTDAVDESENRAPARPLFLWTADQGSANPDNQRAVADSDATTLLPSERLGLSSTALPGMSGEWELPYPHRSGAYTIRITPDGVVTFDGEALQSIGAARLGDEALAAVKERELALRGHLTRFAEQRDSLDAEATIALSEVGKVVLGLGTVMRSEVAQSPQVLNQVIDKLKQSTANSERAATLQRERDIANIAIAILTTEADKQLPSALAQDDPYEAINPEREHDACETWYVARRVREVLAGAWNASLEGLAPPAREAKLGQLMAADPARVAHEATIARNLYRTPENQYGIWQQYAEMLYLYKAHSNKALPGKASGQL
ncbi:MAG TPA: hypothetical protein VLF91_00680 [Candidatus Saccharimonadales bacterium]|nr:hypothetical protein [Candidatus Saccharimonadales bacterium]